MIKQIYLFHLLLLRIFTFIDIFNKKKLYLLKRFIGILISMHREKAVS